MIFVGTRGIVSTSEGVVTVWIDAFNDMRRNSGLSLDELSARSGVPKGTLAKITSGITRTPSLETMRSLVYAMGYTLDDLYGASSDSPAPAQEQGPDDEQRLVSAYRRSSREDQMALLRFADYAARAAGAESSAAERTAPAAPPVRRLSREEEIKIAMEALDAYIGSQGQSHEGRE